MDGRKIRSIKEIYIPRGSKGAICQHLVFELQPKISFRLCNETIDVSTKDNIHEYQSSTQANRDIFIQKSDHALLPRASMSPSFIATSFVDGCFCFGSDGNFKGCRVFSYSIDLDLESTTIATEHSPEPFAATEF